MFFFVFLEHKIAVDTQNIFFSMEEDYSGYGEEEEEEEMMEVVEKALKR